MLSRLRAGICTLLITLGLAACQPAVAIPATIYTPTTVGVVTATTPRPGRTTVFTLSDGASVTIDDAQATVVDGSGNASVHDLLLVDDTATWVASLRTSTVPDAPDGCFELPKSGVDDGDHIKFTNGLRLPKAANFDPGLARESKNGQYDYPQVVFCVDAMGFVISYGW